MICFTIIRLSSNTHWTQGPLWLISIHLHDQITITRDSVVTVTSDVAWFFIRQSFQHFTIIIPIIHGAARCWWSSQAKYYKIAGDSTFYRYFYYEIILWFGHGNTLNESTRVRFTVTSQLRHSNILILQCEPNVRKCKRGDVLTLKSL